MKGDEAMKSKDSKPGGEFLDLLMKIYMAARDSREEIVSLLRCDFGKLRKETLQEFAESMVEAKKLACKLAVCFYNCPFSDDGLCTCECDECEVFSGCRWWMIMACAVQLVEEIISYVLEAVREVV